MPFSLAPARRASAPALQPKLVRALISAGLIGTSGALWAADQASTPTTEQPASTVSSAATPSKVSSSMDGQLFYQLLIAELQANSGDAGTAYQLYLDAAKRQQSNQLYQRAVEIALQARAGEQALTAAKAWRQALPQSREASEFTAQILLALGRTNELAAPLRTLIQLTPAPQQPQVISTLPRTLARLSDRKAAAQVIEDATPPWRQPPLEIAEAWAASAEGWLQAKDHDKAFAATRKALFIKPDLSTGGLLAIDLMGTQPDAEALVKKQLAAPDAPQVVRLAYARRLAVNQRFAESAQQLDQVLQTAPEQTGTRVTLAAVLLELKDADRAEAALQPVLALEKAKAAAGKLNDPSQETDLEQAYLLMAQVADQRKQFALAEQWLDKADPKREKLAVQTQHARLLMAQGQSAKARAVLRGVAETEPRDAILKAQSEAQLLRDLRQWEEAYKVLASASARFPDDSDLLYDQAMMAEKTSRLDDMESLLRRVMALAPDNANAFNALGYSLAERGVRLVEARKLLTQALTLRPGDPFITDSMGWLEFRTGRVNEAVVLLRDAYQSRPDPEIAAHLGEVLWSQGKQDEAKQIWREALGRDADNEALKDTLKRLKASL